MGAKPDEADNEGETPLYLAVIRDNVDVVKLLLDWGADPNKTNNYGETPLYGALQNMYQNIKVVAKLLIDGGAKPSKRDMLLMKYYDERTGLGKLLLKVI